MSLPAITPVAKSLYLCDGHIGIPNRKTDLLGIFNAVRAAHYPHGQTPFVIFAQLIGGQGQIPFYFDIRYAADGTLVHTTNAKLLIFPHRAKLVQLAYTIGGCIFPQAGIYLVELCCNGQWVADTTLELL